MQDIEKIYKEYFETVNKYLFCLTKNNDISEELTQETFYKAVKKIDTYRGECKISVWLCQIAKNLWYDQCRKNKKIVNVEEKDLLDVQALNTLEEQIYKSNYFCCTLKCFKNELSKDIRYRNKSYHEDISFTLELMCKAKTQLYFDEILYVYYKEKNTSTIDNYTVRKALDFTIQTLEYLYLADKYKDKKQFIMNRISQEKYLQKISKLIDWVENDKPYTYQTFLKQ